MRSPFTVAARRVHSLTVKRRLTIPGSSSDLPSLCKQSVRIITVSDALPGSRSKHVHHPEYVTYGSVLRGHVDGTYSPVYGQRDGEHVSLRLRDGQSADLSSGQRTVT